MKRIAIMLAAVSCLGLTACSLAKKMGEEVRANEVTGTSISTTGGYDEDDEYYETSELTIHLREVDNPKNTTDLKVQDCAAYPIETGATFLLRYDVKGYEDKPERWVEMDPYKAQEAICGKSQ